MARAAVVVGSSLVQSDVLLERILGLLDARPRCPAEVAEALEADLDPVCTAMWGLLGAGAIRAVGIHVGASDAVVPWTAFTFASLLRGDAPAAPPDRRGARAARRLDQARRSGPN